MEFRPKPWNSGQNTAKHGKTRQNTGQDTARTHTTGTPTCPHHVQYPHTPGTPPHHHGDPDRHSEPATPLCDTNARSKMSVFRKLTPLGCLENHVSAYKRHLQTCLADCTGSPGPVLPCLAHCFGGFWPNTVVLVVSGQILWFLVYFLAKYRDFGVFPGQIP